MSSKLIAGNATNGSSLSADTTGILEIQTGSTSTTAITVDASQNVGIGTSSPFVKLQVTGTIKVATGNAQGILSLGEAASSTTNCGIYRGAAGAPTTDGNYLNIGGYDGVVFTTGNAAIASQTERMRIDSSGNLMVATTNSTPGNGTGNNVSGFAVNTNGTTWASRSGFAALSVNRVDTTGDVLRAASAGNQVGGISVTSVATVFNTTSDYRLKENIAPMTGALAKVSALNPVTYTWKLNGSDGQGFIAHELQAIVPDAVTGEKDAVDAEGNPVYQGIDTSFLVATLTAAIQELNAKVDAQAAEIQILKGAA